MFICLKLAPPQTPQDRRPDKNPRKSKFLSISKTAGFGNVRVAPNRESLAKTEIVEGTEASQKNDAHGHTFEKRSKSVCEGNLIVAFAGRKMNADLA
jgi:hypothetical protein